MQADILNLLTTLREERQLTYLLVSRDLAVIAHMCRDVAIMQAGEIVEQVPVECLRSGELDRPIRSACWRRAGPMARYGPTSWRRGP